MNTIVKNNIKKIRKENTNGNFSTVKNSILNDNRLSASARLLLIYVFAKSDDFAYSESNILNFLNVTHKTYYKIREELVQYGYLKINTNVTMKSQNYYIFSEYGNLSNVEDTEQPQPKQKEPEISEIEQPQIEQTSVDELCTLSDLVNSTFYDTLTNLIIDITSEGYIVDEDKLLDMFVSKVTKKQLEKGFSLKKIKKTIIEKFATKIEQPSTKIASDNEIREMILSKNVPLTNSEIEGLIIKVRNKLKSEPKKTLADLSSTINGMASGLKNQKTTKTTNEYYQN